MKVFISWSGEQSKLLGQVLREWLPRMLHAVRPYFSPDDVAKGARWTSEIATELQGSGFGILCLTEDNVTAPWMAFEAGALSKNLDKSRVCPVLFGVHPTDVTGPLAQFQATRFEKTEIRQLVRAMNSQLGDGALPADVLTDAFEMWWPRLENEITSAREKVVLLSHRRDVRDALEELLTLTRGISEAVQSTGQAQSWSQDPAKRALMADLLVACEILCVHAEGSTHEQTRLNALRLLRPLGGLFVTAGASTEATRVAALMQSLLKPPDGQP